VDETQKQKYYDKYRSSKQKGVKFFPDIIYKDLIVSFAIFLLLVGLAIFVGVANEPKADPSDTVYIPRPEWYFLFLFQMLKYFPGKIEWVGTTIIPGLAILILFLLPFIDRNPRRHWSQRRLAIGIMSVIVIGMVGLTIVGAVTTPPQPESGTLAGTLAEEIAAGQDLYSVQCVECHGADGEGGEIKGVEGLEGVVLKPINDQDVMYPFTDSTIYNIIEMGQPVAGMPPFGRAYGGELGPGEIEAIVTFMRYTWDDRAELPQEAAAAAALPTLAADEVPSFDVHIAPVIKRYCISCHRPGKENNNYFMRDYNEVITSGDHNPNVIPGDLDSNMIRMLHREEIEAGGPMPPTKALKPELVKLFERWVLGGAPETAEQAAQASGAAGLPVTETLTTTTPITGTLEINPTGIAPTQVATPILTPTETPTAIPLAISDAAIEAIQSIRSLLGLPDLPLAFIENAHMINSPSGDLPVAIYRDTEGRKYSVFQASNQVVEMDGRDALPIFARTPGAMTIDDGMRAKAKQIAASLLPDFESISSGLVYEEGAKGDYTFFTWRDHNAQTLLNKPFLQIGFYKNGLVFAFYNTLILK